MLMRSGLRLKTENIKEAIKEENQSALEVTVSESLKPENESVLTPRQAQLSVLMRAGLKIKSDAINKANESALKAAIAESLKPSKRSFEKSVPGRAELPTSPSSLQRRPALRRLGTPTNVSATPAPPTRRAPPPLPPRRSNGLAGPVSLALPPREASPPLPPRRTGASTKSMPPASLARLGPMRAASYEQTLGPIVGAQPQSRKNPIWRKVFPEQARVLAKISNRINSMRHNISRTVHREIANQIENAERDAQKQYMSLMQKFRQANNFVRNANEVVEMVVDAFNTVNRGFDQMKARLEQARLEQARQESARPEKAKLKKTRPEKTKSEKTKSEKSTLEKASAELFR
ncbi:hypothetical protein GWC77_25940 [Paraburkholderia sp. NMBU_R16]|uniref:hypothetical protein n=1 Tax=Paraburkholderia sp. NMBU_R16 TaxID=2698676 RepID=UPI001567647E|nr:hypothetical protein [Paraburkholderia sp. NMBU_R16]NRO99332.1 hypothetical protein [Paraburkholderia sp. NMBU_R16]